jgi:hypothetical protein
MLVDSTRRKKVRSEERGDPPVFQPALQLSILIVAVATVTAA